MPHGIHVGKVGVRVKVVHDNISCYRKVPDPAFNQRGSGPIDLSGTNIVINKDYKKGQLSSLIAGIKNTPEQTEAILLCLVDCPFITKNLVNSIITKFKQTKSPIIVPVFNKERGHPTLFASSLFDQLLNAPQDQGARYVLYSNEDKVTELETPDPGARISIDTPADYKAHFQADP